VRRERIRPDRTRGVGGDQARGVGFERTGGEESEEGRPAMGSQGPICIGVRCREGGEEIRSVGRGLEGVDETRDVGRGEDGREASERLGTVAA